MTQALALIPVHALNAQDQARCGQPGPTTGDGRAVTCPICAPWKLCPACGKRRTRLGICDPCKAEERAK